MLRTLKGYRDLRPTHEQIEQYCGAMEEKKDLLHVATFKDSNRGRPSRDGVRQFIRGEADELEAFISDGLHLDFPYLTVRTAQHPRPRKARVVVSGNLAEIWTEDDTLVFSIRMLDVEAAIRQLAAVS